MSTEGAAVLKHEDSDVLPNKGYFKAREPRLGETALSHSPALSGLGRLYIKLKSFRWSGAETILMPPSDPASWSLGAI